MQEHSSGYVTDRINSKTKIIRRIHPIMAFVVEKIVISLFDLFLNLHSHLLYQFPFQLLTFNRVLFLDMFVLSNKKEIKHLLDDQYKISPLKSNFIILSNFYEFSSTNTHQIKIDHKNQCENSQSCGQILQIYSQNEFRGILQSIRQ